MLFGNLDKLYEAAGRDRAEFEKLLLRAQKERRFLLIFTLAMIALLAVPIVWLSAIVFQAVLYLRAGRLDLMDASLKPISKFRDLQPALIGAGFNLSLMFTFLIVGIRETSVRVHMLLLFRGLHDRN